MCIRDSYNPHAPNLTLYRDFRLITLHPQELTMIKALNTTDARQVLAWLQDLINDTAVRREEITPVYELSLIHIFQKENGHYFSGMHYACGCFNGVSF